MSELTITLLRLGYLVLLWVLVLSAIGVLRRDLYGTRITDRRRRKAPVAAAARRVATEPARPTAPTPHAPLDPQRRRARAGSWSPRARCAARSSRSGRRRSCIGRAPSCTLVLDDDYSSSRHARIFPQGGQWFVEDLGSTNGTFVADQRVEAPTPAPDGYTGPRGPERPRAAEVTR